MLNIIFGASGIGKNRLCTSIATVPWFDLIVKGTTRKVKPYDGGELTYVSDEELKSEYQIIYSHNLDPNHPDYHFGVKQEDLIRANTCSDKEFFLFCNDINIIEQLNLEYEHTRVFLFQIDDYPAMLRSQNKENPQPRIDRLQALYSIAHQPQSMALFDGIIFYKYRKNQETISNNLARRQLFDLVSEETQCIEYDTINSTRIAVMMPQGVRQFEIDHYNKVFKLIKNTIEGSTNPKFTVERITNSDTIIIKDIIETIKKSNRVIVDLSQARSNCMFEAGYTIGMNKRFLFIRDKHTDVGFDAQSYNIEEYDLESDKKGLQSILINWLKREGVIKEK